MLAKWWKRIGFIILVIAILFNVTSKLAKRVSFSDNVKSTVKNIVTDNKDKEDSNQNITENQ